jgi:hypothetical protein
LSPSACGRRPPAHARSLLPLALSPAPALAVSLDTGYVIRLAGARSRKRVAYLARKVCQEKRGGMEGGEARLTGLTCPTCPTCPSAQSLTVWIGSDRGDRATSRPAAPGRTHPRPMEEGGGPGCRWSKRVLVEAVRSMGSGDVRSGMCRAEPRAASCGPLPRLRLRPRPRPRPRPQRRPRRRPRPRPPSSYRVLTREKRRVGQKKGGGKLGARGWAGSRDLAVAMATQRVKTRR